MSGDGQLLFLCVFTLSVLYYFYIVNKKEEEGLPTNHPILCRQKATMEDSGKILPGEFYVDFHAV
jgi:hypothetical protein